MGSDFQKINCKVDDDPCLELYKILYESTGELDKTENLSENYLFFPLPAFSYHVTLVDGLNQAHLENKGNSIIAGYRDSLMQFLIDLPGSMKNMNLLMPMLKFNSLIISGKKITVEFDELTIWGNHAMVAGLKAANDDSHSLFNEMEKDRKEFYTEFYKKYFGTPVPGKKERYIPHITLGYFGNTVNGQNAQSKIVCWNKIFENRLMNKTLTFGSSSFYGFTDMTTYFRSK